MDRYDQVRSIEGVIFQKVLDHADDHTVAMNIYPSPPARDLNLVTNGQPEGLVLIFLAWVLTDGQQYLPEMGYVSLPQEQLDNQLGKLGY